MTSAPTPASRSRPPRPSRPSRPRRGRSSRRCAPWSIEPACCGTDRGKQRACTGMKRKEEAMNQVQPQPAAKFQAETWGAFINGEFVPAAGGKTFPTFNPGNGEVVGHLAVCDEEDIERAGRAALAALPAWRRRTGAARAKSLIKLAQLVEAHGAKLAELESINAGKPIRDSKAIDAVTAIDPLEYFAGMATKLQGETIPVPGPYVNMTL